MLKPTKYLFTSFFLLFLLLLNFPVKVNAQQEKRFATDRLLVKYRSGVGEEARERLRQRLNLPLAYRIERLDIESLAVKDSKVEEKVREVLRDPNIEYAEPDYLASALEVSSDPEITKQWGMFKTQAAGASKSAWDYSKSNSNIKIAILDTGIDQDHQDLNGKVVQSKNCTTTSSVDDFYGHGTHVAGIAAAATNNSLGVAGLGYNAALVNAKVLDDTGSGYYSWIVSCLIWSADNGAKVINMSLGAPYQSKTLENAVNYAWNKGVVLVAAAGNSHNSSPTYPAYYKNVIAVAATDKNDKKASFSSYGSWVDVAAPGVDIFSTFPNSPYTIGKSLNYDYGSGTSMATPHVAGLAALVWDTPFGMNNAKVRTQIEATADKIAGTGKYWSQGRINALKAVTQTVSPLNPRKP